MMRKKAAILLITILTILSLTIHLKTGNILLIPQTIFITQSTYGLNTNLLENYEKIYSCSVNADCPNEFSKINPDNLEDQRYNKYFAKPWKTIGIFYQQTSKGTEITDVVKNSPAQKAGITEGDTVYGLGEYDEEYTLKVCKPGCTKNTTITVEGEENNIYADTIQDQYTYIRIMHFLDPNTSYDFEKQLEKLDKTGSRGLIVDLRYTHGGYLQHTVEIADLILKEGEISRIKYENGKTSIITASKEKSYEKPIVILVNNHTRSSAEALTQALVQNKKAKTIGTHTYGKNKVYKAYNLADGTILTLPVAHYQTQTGKPFPKQGIKPDHELKNTSTSNYIQKAIQTLKKQDE